MKWKTQKINEVENLRTTLKFAWFPVVMSNGDLLFWEEYLEVKKYHFSSFWGFKWFIIKREQI